MTFESTDLESWLAAAPDAHFSAALFLEVGMTMPDLPTALSELARVLRPGAPLFASLRSRHFFAQLAVSRRDWTMAREVSRSDCGLLPGMGWQNWHTAEGLRAKLAEAGFAEPELIALGPLSGISGDPMARIAVPSELSRAEQNELATLEVTLGGAPADCGRYILASTVRL